MRYRQRRLGPQKLCLSDAIARAGAEGTAKQVLDRLKELLAEQKTRRS